MWWGGGDGSNNVEDAATNESTLVGSWDLIGITSVWSGGTYTVPASDITSDPLSYVFYSNNTGIQNYRNSEISFQWATNGNQLSIDINSYFYSYTVSATTLTLMFQESGEGITYTITHTFARISINDGDNGNGGGDGGNSDTLLPNTSISTGPTNPTNSTSTSFVFTATEADTTFQCSLDGGAYADCTSLKIYTDLVEGNHTFSVRATDAAGNTDLTPAVYGWTIDTTPPVVTVPAGITAIAPVGSGVSVTNAEIQAFLSGATAADSVDGGVSSGITDNAPTTFPLGVATVTFSVTDAAGNTGSDTTTVEVIAGNMADPSGGELIWAKRAGGTSSDDGVGVASFPDGSSVITGFFGATATFGSGEVNETTLTSAGSNDIFVARYNADGTLAWAKSAGGTGSDLSFSIASFSDGSSVVTGVIRGTVTFGFGETNQTILTSSGEEDVFIAHYNADGTLVWAKKAGGTGSDEGFGIASFSDGSSAVIGAFEGTMTFGSGEANQTSLTSLGFNNDIFVARYNADGILAWAKKAGGNGYDRGSGIASFADGSSVVTGSFLGTAVFGSGEANQTSLVSSGPGDVFIAHYNKDGTLAGAKRAGGTGSDWGRDIASFLDGSSVVTGSFSGTTEFGSGEVNQTILTSSGLRDIFIAKFSQQPQISNLVTLTWEGLVSSLSGGTTQQQTTLVNLDVMVGATAGGVISIDISTPGRSVPSLSERKFFEGAVIDMSTTIGDWTLWNIRPGHVDIDVGASWMFRARSDCCPGSAGAIDSPDVIDNAEDISFSMVSADPNFLAQTLPDSVSSLVDYFPISAGAVASAVNIFDINGVRVLVDVTNMQ